MDSFYSRCIVAKEWATKTIRIRPSTYERLEQVAEEESTTPDEVITLLLDRHDILLMKEWKNDPQGPD